MAVGGPDSVAASADSVDLGTNQCGQRDRFVTVKDIAHGFEQGGPTGLDSR